MQDASTRSSRIARTIDVAVTSVGALGVACFTTLIVYVVVCRYAFSFTPRWSEEIPRLLLVWVTFIGGISAFIRRTHLSAGLTDLLVKPGRLRTALTMLAAVCSAFFLIVLLWTGWKLTALTWSHETTALSWPVGLTYLALPVSAALSLIAILLVEWRK
ncbi:TRAP transporter small permease [Pseudorhizobium endolithicum]|uniref:TRAP transporter small permease protein n=1 Tax=Pseudorhizobium endolithicum TaxID=1191678 RepID=A0ABM8PLG3_9HYPH|nr:TRAP transporter small permease [Pseudorhizobium endolithicum]CAD7036461.1 TRAP transporter small permease [Pseudorhizobium endolithicum]